VALAFVIAGVTTKVAVSVSLWSQPSRKIDTSLGLTSFLQERGDRYGCPRAVKTPSDVGNEAFTPADCHDNKRSVLSEWTHVVEQMTV
jgi:hypothetical protein